MQPQAILIETPRLLLKAYGPEAIQFMFENFSKAQTMRELGHADEKEYTLELYKVQNGYAAYNRTFLMFFLVTKENNHIIGRCGLHNWNKEHRRAEIGYHIGIESYKRKGYMTEAVEAIIKYGFETLNLNRIEALTSDKNTASVKVIEGRGLQKKGDCANIISLVKRTKIPSCTVCCRKNM